MFPSRLVSVLGKGALENNYSLSFDGTNDYVSVADDSTLDFIDGQAFSVSCWFKTTNATDEMYLFDKRAGGGTSAGYAALLDGNSTNYLGYVADGSNAATFSNTTDYHDGEWHHFAFSFDGTSVISSYIDGVLVGTDTQTLGSTANANALIIGAHRDGSSSPFNGKIDEVSIWNKALSAGDISALYQAKGTSDLNDDGNSANLQGWWRMGDGTLDDGNVAGNGLIADQVNPTLGSEMIPNVNFDTSANWVFDDAYAHNATTKKAEYDDSMSGKLIMTDGEMLSSIVSGKVYRLSFTVSDGTMNTSWYNTGISNVYIASAVYTAGTHILYFIAPISNGGLLPYTSTSGTTFSIDDISLKEVNGNPGIMTSMASDAIVKDTP